MSNPKPTQTERFKQHQFKRESTVVLSDRITGTKLPVAPINVEAIVDAMPNKAAFLRQAVIHELSAIGLLSKSDAEELIKSGG
ncbi:hypothetical protein NIES2135_61690 (plasmid) [Leptolyngbya boryana NIES-2135]|jgi:hypothetical protein|uniref:Uncharacterized protein n=1 Tax=Leptolyngbya boryana NIES-2135 TaxID=1973484 RepID=A0A1Z4JRD5_LEPBY|nr:MULTISPECIES: hypothetical protein [Leptolyngbya]BAY59292.1 hypothetical protein NIES2135_61690 [Leptolyngbya boryana NIES-2135]MBD2372880.1 hypothetical protein [Leptolyngbya sp. FACHB-238]MBD2397367.1 hypothetical protein [Leptolyngbya sp. FACHB-239]MBD2403828.1 hypothetical protein [Leptolyngbya sp. FACHB-402]ULP33484.1 hypothetical protein MCP04_30610 [Leptolyngbya boryana IU 594]